MTEEKIIVMFLSNAKLVVTDKIFASVCNCKRDRKQYYIHV